jgi:riboflavin kinase/FMN adenylyltransferase
MGLSIEPAEALRLNGGESVCSSNIRECLSEGSIDKANEYLSRPYFMTGTVVEGRQVGRTIGYPTANLMLDDASKLVPKDGVYAVRVVVNDVHAYNAIMNIGTRPTLNDGRGRTIEIHLLDFSGSLYGARMRVEFIGFIRDERKFDNFEQLKHQISIDKADAIKIFR